MFGATFDLRWLHVSDYHNFRSLKDSSLEINSLALNKCFSYRNVFQNGVNALSKIVIVLCFYYHQRKHTGTIQSYQVPRISLQHPRYGCNYGCRVLHDYTRKSASPDQCIVRHQGVSDRILRHILTGQSHPAR